MNNRVVKGMENCQEIKSNWQCIWAVRRLRKSTSRCEEVDYIPIVDVWIWIDTSRHQLPQNDSERPLHMTRLLKTKKLTLLRSSSLQVLNIW